MRIKQRMMNETKKSYEEKVNKQERGRNNGQNLVII